MFKWTTFIYDFFVPPLIHKLYRAKVKRRLTMMKRRFGLVFVPPFLSYRLGLAVSKMTD